VKLKKLTADTWSRPRFFME